MELLLRLQVSMITFSVIPPSLRIYRKCSGGQSVQYPRIGRSLVCPTVRLQAFGNANSDNPSVSGDGRYVAFASDATNLVSGCMSCPRQIYVRDTAPGQNRTVLVSVSSAGVPGNAESNHPFISESGRYIVFASKATNLVSPGTTTGLWHVYLRDRDTDEDGIFDEPGEVSTVLVDIRPDGGEPVMMGGGFPTMPMISSDGRFVAFSSSYTDLLPSLANGIEQVYVRDMASGALLIRMASISSTGAAGNGSSILPTVSDDGTLVVYESGADNRVGSISSTGRDIFLTDLGASAWCYANCDGSTTPPVLNVADFLCFQAAYTAGELYANCDGSTAPPVINIQDYLCFQAAFAAGCP